jgi:hypothetical protein
VIQKLIKKPNYESEAFNRIFNFIYSEVYTKINELCVNRNGLCVVKTIIIGTTDAIKRKNIVEIIYRNAVTNAKNPYGNYAITEIITNWPKTVCEPIFLAFRG